MLKNTPAATALMLTLAVQIGCAIPPIGAPDRTATHGYGIHDDGRLGVQGGAGDTDETTIPELRRPLDGDTDLLKRAATFSCRFAGIDSDLVIDTIRWRGSVDEPWIRGGTAVFRGNAGSADLTGVRGMDTVSFTEVVPSGAVNLMTVYAMRTEPDGSGPFIAVYSRHISSLGSPFPSIRHGGCTPR